jgi:hypothetical protein
VASPSSGVIVAVSRNAADASVRVVPVLDAQPAACTGLQCAVVPNCDGTNNTVLSGTLYDPAGRNPLPDALVYIPIDPLGQVPAIALGTAACGACPAFKPGGLVSITLTDYAGHFSLSDVPAGQRIPLVFQIGKWRREVFLEVPSCVETVVPPSLSRLPKNQTEGDMPQLAILAGGCDRLPCFVSDLGLDPSEFTGPDGGGRVHVYKGAGPGPDLSSGTAGDCTGDAGACPLWSNKDQLAKYDTLLLGCECGENDQTKPDKLPLHDWLGAGGTVLAIHSQRTWFENGPDDFRTVANWGRGSSSRPFGVGTSFVVGQIFNEWLGRENALGADGSLLLNPAQVSTSVSTANSNATSWIVGETSSDAAAPSGDDAGDLRGDVKVFSFLTPVGGSPLALPNQPLTTYCGRTLFTDIHPGGADVVDRSPVPASCQGGEMSVEEKALEFLFFDLTNCLTATLSNKGVPPNILPH